MRRATPSHAPAIRAIADAAWRVTYRDLLRPETVDWFLERAYSEERVALADRAPRDVGRGAGRRGRRVRGERDRARPGDPGGDLRRSRPARPRAWAQRCSDAITSAHPDLPVAADVLVGNAAAEPFYVARGFMPEEDVDEELGGEHVRERRWWLRPAT